MSEPTVSLQQFIEVQLAADRKLSETKWAAHMEAHALLEKALDLARNYMDAKLLEMNEVRRQINEERGIYATKGHLEAATQKLELQVQSTSKITEATRTQLALIAAAVAVGVPIALYFLG